MGDVIKKFYGGGAKTTLNPALNLGCYGRLMLFGRLDDDVLRQLAPANQDR